MCQPQDLLRLMLNARDPETARPLSSRQCPILSAAAIMR
jgi:hypothetical protein